MIKLLGAICVLAAGTIFGFHQALQLSRRPAQIRELIRALLRLETEIAYGASPLPEALARVGRQLSPPLAAMLRSASDKLGDGSGRTTETCWREAIESGWGGTAMKSAERHIFQQLGHSLGISDREDQKNHLRLAVSQLQAEEQTAADEQKRYEKMWKSLGVLAGALLVILMY